MPRRMLEHCLSICAWKFAEQCSTNRQHELTKNFWLLEHSSHVSNVRRGAARFDSLGAEKTRTAALRASLAVA